MKVVQTISSTPDAIGPQTTMQQVLHVFPGAQRALFRRYHIGGCSSCGFQPTETLEQLCHRNNNLNLNEVLEHIRASHEQDAKMLVSPAELAKLREQNPSLRLLDVRTREEYEAIHIEGAVLMSQEIMQEILGRWPRTELRGLPKTLIFSFGFRDTTPRRFLRRCSNLGFHDRRSAWRIFLSPNMSSNSAGRRIGSIF